MIDSSRQCIWFAYSTSGTVVEQEVEPSQMQRPMGLTVRDVRSGNGMTQSGAELLQSGRELTTKVGEQPWP